MNKNISLLVGLIIVSPALTSCSNNQQAEQKHNREIIMSHVDEYAAWISEPGLDDITRERRACEVMQRMNRLRELGHQQAVDEFISSLKSKINLNAPSSETTSR